ncbi:MAG: hypothetical protein ACP5TY_11220 [Thermodesulforhabdaceae bacterium]
MTEEGVIARSEATKQSLIVLPCVIASEAKQSLEIATQSFGLLAMTEKNNVASQ